MSNKLENIRVIFSKNKILYTLIIATTLAVGIYFRLYHIEFGLPHSFYADEPEIAELAIKYTYEFRDIVKNNNQYKLIPISFVYGTVPTYFFTIATMLYSKTGNILGLVIDKVDIYIFLRTLSAVTSMIIPLTTAYLVHLIFKNKLATITALVLASLNWKLIVHAHYINADIIQTVLIALSFLTAYKYTKTGKTAYTLLTAILFGLAVGTKITTAITLPLYAYLYIKKKDFMGLVGFCLVSFGVFILSNPFAMVLANDYAFRVYTMITREGGTVFDSVDTSPTKYLLALSYIINPLILLTSLYGMYKSLKSKDDLEINIFLIGHVIIYLVFYSVQSRRVDRWLLPLIPIMIIYSAWAFTQLRAVLIKPVYFMLVSIVTISYLNYPILLLQQFQRQTPKSAAYLWLQENTNPSANKLVYTEEGLDPINKLPGAHVLKVNVYGDQGAQYFLPDSPLGYDYIVVSSRPLSNYKRPEIKKQYPLYHGRWEEFEQMLNDSQKFELIKDFVLPKPNLIPLSDVFIYRNIAVSGNLQIQ